MITLSVLVCSTHTRRKTFAPFIQDQLFGQWEQLSEADRDRVEILILTDNKTMMLGDKRNVMVDMARGDYVQFVDDDDRVEPDMISSVLAAIDQDKPDVVTFLASVSLNGGEPKPCRYSVRFRRDLNAVSEYQRLPNHICAVRRELARRASFPSLVRGEDSGFSKVLRPLLKTEHHIDRVLYHYDYSDATTETQRPIRAPLRQRPGVPPLVDVIILADSRSPALKRMTQKTIDTCLSGANGLPVRVVVLEGQPHLRHRRAETLHNPKPFHYNRSANRGARAGSAEWIMVANNDLTFTDGWLHALLAAEHPLVSPLNPGDPRQRDITEPEAGRVNGRHLSGWCFMIKRELWEQIGGFDERVSFWCSDNAVLEQAVAAGVEPLLVPDSRVRHLGSVTMRTVADDALTWEQVHIFNGLYPDRALFPDHPAYLRYLQQREKACQPAT